MIEFVDTHTHTYDEAFTGEEDAVVERAVRNGVKHLLQADVDGSERGRMLDLCSRHRGTLHPMLGLYPGSVTSDWERQIEEYIPLRSPEVVAIGEIGLDYHYGTENRKEQKEAFRAQLELASKWDLPVNIHLREATEDFFLIMDSCRGMRLRGNLHAFSGSAETFRRLQRYGEWYAGIGGVITFKNSKLPLAVAGIPLERILLETDAPYLSPVPFRGSRNESSYIPVIAGHIAAIKGVTPEEVGRVTTQNARTLFSI